MPSDAPLSTEEMILKIVQSLEEKVDGLEDGQSDIKATLATHEERSLQQATRIGHVEKAGGAVTLALIVALFSVFISGCGATQKIPKYRNASTIGRALHATVALENYYGVFCSGVIIDGIVLTAHHCVENGQPVVVRSIDARKLMQVAAIDKTSDLAILEATDGTEFEGGVRLARKAPRFADDIWVIGHALGRYEFSVTAGIVSHPSRHAGLNGGRWMQHDAGQSGGNSGGPVLNKQGRLVGISSFTIIEGVLCAFACPGIYQTTHMKGAVHHEEIRNMLGS